MKLADYLNQPERSASALAADCNVAVSTITRAAKGSVPNGRLMQLIFERTGGAVTPNDFFGIEIEADHAQLDARSGGATSPGNVVAISSEVAA